MTELTRSRQEAMSGDFGGIVHHTPREVVRPETAREVAAVVQNAAVPVVPRGRGHSMYGQAQTTGGILVDMRGLRTVHEVTADSALTDAGATWREVLNATLPYGLTPPVLTDHLDLTVGGTLSAGGVGGTSHLHGTQADNVLELQVVTPNGDVLTCSPAERRDLFDAVRGGLGRHGIITRATLRLIPAPERVRSYKIPCESVTELLAAQRRIDADHLSGQAKPGPPWRYELTAVVYGTHRARPAAGARATQTHDLSYTEFADRMRPDVEELITLGEWARPHPWGIVLLPGEHATEVIEATLTTTRPDDLGMSGVVLINPLTVRHVPMLRAPAQPVLFGLLRTASPGAAPLTEMLAANQTLHKRSHAVGGTRYPIDAAPYQPRDLPLDAVPPGSPVTGAEDHRPDYRL